MSATEAEEALERLLQALLGASAAGHVVLGIQVLLVPREAEHREQSPAAREMPAGCVFRKEGEYWTIAYAGSVVRLKHVRGLECLARLLRHPGRDFHAVDLVAAPEGTADSVGAMLGRMNEDELAELGLQASGAGDAGPMLDADAKAAYRRRLLDLQSELEEAQAFNDLGRTGTIQEEIHRVTQQLVSAVGLGGRARLTASAAERARLCATRAIKTAIERISEHHPLLGRHLACSIKTGTFCCYAPDPRAPISWTF